MVLSRWCYVPHDSAHLFNSLPTTSRFLRRCQIPNYTAWRQRHNGKQLAQGCYILQCPDGESIASRDFSIASRLPYRCASSYTLHDQLITHYFNIHIMPKLVSVLLLILHPSSSVATSNQWCWSGVRGNINKLLLIVVMCSIPLLHILWSGLQVSQIGFCLTGSISLIFLKAVAWVCCNKVIWIWWDQSLVD